MNNNIEYDPIHLNNNIVDIFIDILNKKDILSKNFFMLNNDSFKLKKHIKFNTYVIDKV